MIFIVAFSFYLLFLTSLHRFLFIIRIYVCALIISIALAMWGGAKLLQENQLDFSAGKEAKLLFMPLLMMLIFGAFNLIQSKLSDRRFIIPNRYILDNWESVNWNFIDMIGFLMIGLTPMVIVI